MQIRLITSEQEFAELAFVWRKLFAANPAHSPFQSWEWNYSWWQHHGTAGQLRLLIGEHDGEIAGLAPLCLQRSFRGLPQAHLSFISRKRGDYLDFLTVPGKAAEFFTALFAYLKEQHGGWSFLDLSDLHRDSPNVLQVLAAANLVFPTATVEAREICVTVPLTSTWETFQAGLGKNARRNIGRYGRALEKDFKVEFRVPVGREQMQQGLSDFAAVYRGRWQDEHGKTYFDDADAMAFERQLCELATGQSWYRLYLLYADEQPIAGYLGYICNNKYYAGLLAHVPQFHKYSVGTVLIGKTVEDCIAQGWTELDMTRGNEPYKFQWNGVAKRNFHVRIFASRFALLRVALVDWIYWRATEMTWLHRLRAALRRAAAPKSKDATPPPAE